MFKAVQIVIVALVLLAAAAALFVASGFYNIGADDHHTAMTLAIIEKLRDRSIASRARSIDVQLVSDPERIAAGAQQDPQRAFWIVKHGIKMSAMPAWGKSLDDAAIWEVVSFVRKMPEMTPETYQEIAKQHAG